MRINKKFFVIGITTFIVSLAVIGLFGGGKASAATLTVDSGCTLPEAIEAINNVQDENGCNHTGSAYGTSDTINIPAGTITLSADLPAIVNGVQIKGSGQSDTTINANGHLGFNSNLNSNQYTRDVSISDLKVTNADTAAIQILTMRNVTLSNVEVTESNHGVTIQATRAIVKDSYIHDNTDNTTPSQGQVSGAGLAITLETVSLSNVLHAEVDGTRISNNTGIVTGIIMSASDQLWGDSNNTQLSEITETIVRNTSVTNNHASEDTGIFLIQSGGPLTRNPAELEVSAVTVANNEVVVTSPVTSPQVGQLPVIAGILVTGKLTGTQTVTNVTVANNTISNPAPDVRQTLAGFFGSLGSLSTDMAIRNTTVAGNTVTQPSSAQPKMPSFFAAKVTLNQSYQVTSIANGSSAVNTLIVNNKFNGQNASCLNGFNTDFFGLSGQVDLAPTNAGHNMTDDQACAGYTYVANLWDTVDHQVVDNGGPVPTIKLLPGSPAINGGGQVLGVTTDARGVSRNGYYSVGAYQGELLAAATTNSTLAKTGVVTVSAVIVGLILLIILIYTYIDYLRHRKPLVEADPFARQTYTYRHHISTVSIPLLKYRVHISFNRSPSGISKF